MSPIILGLLAFVGVAALVGGGVLLFSGDKSNRLEDRLDLLTGTTMPSGRGDLAKDASVLAKPLDDSPGLFQGFLERFGNIELLFEQADTSLTITQFGLVSGVMALAGGAMAGFLGPHAGLIPVGAVVLGILPLGWLFFRRGRRLKAFGVQLPDALEMMARTLRAGQSLGFGFNVVASEMPQPISKEFTRVFEEQNLGIAMDDSLRDMCERVPNLDLKFFVTAIILQRQTGGDLAEILDKIGELIRDRFRIWGQVQALTGEGRLSGIVLMALPFLLFLAVFQLNREYVMVLFTDPMGKKMLAVAIIMQVLGALVIRKIVNIKV